MRHEPILIVGAGPKALAIYTKARILRELGFLAPPVVIIERTEIGAHWDGTLGYTDGQRLLCTPPEKDLGFPYRSPFGDRVNQYMYEYSWNHYLVETSRISSWIDQGRKHPTHGGWATYLRWAATKAGLVPTYGHVRLIEPEGNLWRASFTLRDGTPATASAQGVIITGPGEAFRLDVQDDDSKISDGKSFWTNLPAFAQLGRDAAIAVIGTGETAATIVGALLDMPGGRTVRIDLINRRGMLYTREEGPLANRFFSDPGNWHNQPLSFRSDFISRADKGVFSKNAKDRIEQAENVHLLARTAKSARIAGSQIELMYGDGQTERYDRVIVATGFNPLSCFKLFPKGIVRLNGSWKNRFNAIAKRVQFDLSLSGLEPKLHLPTLAALEQGPGFPNLTCLGHLADRVLSSYVPTS
jgi:mycobactin lysine-N-oxygenase